MKSGKIVKRLEFFSFFRARTSAYEVNYFLFWSNLTHTSAARVKKALLLHFLNHLCEFIGTKERFCIGKESNSHRISLGHQHGRRFIVLGHQYGCLEVM